MSEFFDDQYARQPPANIEGNIRMSIDEKAFNEACMVVLKHPYKNVKPCSIGNWLRPFIEAYEAAKSVDQPNRLKDYCEATSTASAATKLAVYNNEQPSTSKIGQTRHTDNGGEVWTGNEWVSLSPPVPKAEQPDGRCDLAQGRTVAL